MTPDVPAPDLRDRLIRRLSQYKKHHEAGFLSHHMVAWIMPTIEAEVARLTAERDGLQAQVAAVRALHKPHFKICIDCFCTWPCRTDRALYHADTAPTPADSPCPFCGKVETPHWRCVPAPAPGGAE